MAKVNVIEGSLVQSGGALGAQRNMGQELAEGAGQVALGRQISQTASVMEGFAQRLQAAKNEADLSAARTMMKKGSAAYEEEMQRNQDEDTWGDGWNRNSEQVAAEIMSKDLPPEVMDRLQIDIQDWQESGALRVRQAQTTRTIQRQKAKFANAADYAWSRGETAEGNLEIDKMLRHGLINDDEAGIMKSKGLEISETAQINDILRDNPQEAIDLLKDETEGGKPRNFKGIDSNRRLALLKEAETRLNLKRLETMDQIMEERLAGRIYGADELKELMIKPTQAKWIMDEQTRRGEDPEIVAAGQELWKAIDEYDPVKDSTKKEGLELRYAIARQPPAVQELLKKVYDKKFNSSAYSSSNTEFFNQFDRMYEAGLFGSLRKLSNGAYADPDAAAKAGDLYFRFKVGFDEWANEKPRSNEEKIAYIDSIQKRYRQTATPVLNSLTGRSSRRSQ